MGDFKVKNNQIVFVDCNGFENVLFTYDRFRNHSSVPLYEIAGDTQEPLLMNQLNTFINDFDRINENVPEGLSKETITLCVFLITAELLKKHRNYNVLEIGCDNGVLSCYLAGILKYFNTNNRLICMTDYLDSECRKNWLEKIMLADAADIVSVVTAEYSSDFFKKGYFDIVIINGSVQFDEPAVMINNAVNSAKNNGIIICLPENQYLLNSCFQAVLNNCTEYNQDEKWSVLFKRIDEQDKKNAYECSDEFKLSTVKNEISEILSSIENTVESLFMPDYLQGVNNALVDDAIKKVARAEDDVLNIYSQLNGMNIKFAINELKEALIDFRVCSNEKDRKYNAELCRQKYVTLLQEI